jgi:hypothetical protein
VLLSLTTYASGESETLNVDEVWLTGDTLHIAVTDIVSGERCAALELNLRDYARAGDEYVSVQATNSGGGVSNVIQFKNPYYDSATADVTADPTETESAVPSGNPFTPDGTGEVVDNATDADGKEFFTVETADGNVFYLIVDRERTSDNVYLLNAVTENDLASLAKSGDGKAESAVPLATPSPMVTPEPEATPEPSPPPVEKEKGGNGTIIFLIVAVIAVCGVGYYFKIVRPKQQNDSDDYSEEPEDTSNDIGFEDEEDSE